jgi:hypothetical protein
MVEPTQVESFMGLNHAQKYWKWLAITNASAYNITVIITIVKSFMVMALGDPFDQE